MQVTPAGLQSIYFNLRVAFMEGYARPPLWWNQVAMEIPSTTAENRYAWMSQIPRLRKWLGERMLRNVAANVYTLKNEPYEASIEIDRDDIEDDNLGVYAPIAGQLGEQAARWPQDMIADLLTKAETSAVPAYDGQPFFNGSHPVSPTGQQTGTYSNLLTSTPLTADNYAAARAAMMGYLGEDGKPLSVLPTVLMVPPQLEVKAKQIVESTVAAVVFGSNTAAAAVNNVNQGTAKVLVVPELAVAPGDWYLLDTSKGLKPIIFQNRRAAQLTSMTNPSDEHVFFHRKYIYGVDTRGNAGISLPFLMLKAKA